MSLLNDIEDKHRIKLPDSYHTLANSGKLDQDFQLSDGYIMSLQSLADFEWQNFMNPIEGLVPFAYNGAGEPYCWYKHEPTTNSETKILAAMHGGDGYWYAPNVAGMIFRNELMWYDMKANDQESDDDIYKNLPAVIDMLEGLAPQEWLDILSGLSNRPVIHNRFGDPCLFTEEEINALICKIFGQEYLSTNIDFQLESHN